jgi:hypothetical protein
MNRLLPENRYEYYCSRLSVRTWTASYVRAQLGSTVCCREAAQRSGCGPLSLRASTAVTLHRLCFTPTSKSGTKRSTALSPLYRPDRIWAAHRAPSLSVRATSNSNGLMQRRASRAIHARAPRSTAISCTRAVTSRVSLVCRAAGMTRQVGVLASSPPQTLRGFGIDLRSFQNEGSHVSADLTAVSQSAHEFVSVNHCRLAQ